MSGIESLVATIVGLGVSVGILALLLERLGPEKSEWGFVGRLCCVPLSLVAGAAITGLAIRFLDLAR